MSGLSVLFIASGIIKPLHLLKFVIFIFGPPCRGPYYGIVTYVCLNVLVGRRELGIWPVKYVNVVGLE